MKTYVWILIIILIILGGTGVYVLNGLGGISIESFRINSLQGATAESFTFSGELDVKNPGIIGVRVVSIDYDMVLNDTNEVISTGHFDSFDLPASSTTTVPFDKEVRWKPSLSLAQQLLMKDKVYLIIKGEATVDIQGITTVVRPFEVPINIKSFITSYANQQIAALSGLF